MMRQALAPNRRRAVSVTSQIPVPVGGWNTKDALSNMKPQDARVLDNWFPQTTDVVVRAGAVSHVTGFSSPVYSLLPFKSAAGTAKLFAATDSGIYDVTSPGTVGAAAIAVTNGKMKSIQNATSAGDFLMCVNGADSLKLYNGTTWASITGASTPAITGITTSDIANIFLFKKRVMFIKVDSKSFYYLPVDSIGGAAAEFPCGAYMKEGGYLVAMGNWTLDAGEGADDHLVIATSEGELLMFKGTDPGSAGSWALVGVFNLGPPLGDNCFVKYGSDLIYLSTNGIFSLTKSLVSGALSSRVPFSDKCFGAFSVASASGKDLYGWMGTVIRSASALLLNVPDVTGASVQFVMNTQTGAWCRFTGWTANCLASLEDQLYLADATKVYKGLTGSTDFGNNIQADSAMAYNYFGTKSRKKKVKQVRPLFLASAGVSAAVAIATDFEDTQAYGGTPSAPASGALWDSGVWDTAVWGGSTAMTKNWIHTPSKVGYCHSLKIRVSSRAGIVSWMETLVLTESAAIAP